MLRVVGSSLRRPVSSSWEPSLQMPQGLEETEWVQAPRVEIALPWVPWDCRGWASSSAVAAVVPTWTPRAPTGP